MKQEPKHAPERIELTFGEVRGSSISPKGLTLKYRESIGGRNLGHEKDLLENKGRFLQSMSLKGNLYSVTHVVIGQENTEKNNENPQKFKIPRKIKNIPSLLGKNKIFPVASTQYSQKEYSILKMTQVAGNRIFPVASTQYSPKEYSILKITQIAGNRIFANNVKGEKSES